MGTPEIARLCLERIVRAGHEIVGVYTKPDMPKNRGMKLMQSEVKQYAVSESLPVFQPTTFRDEAVVKELSALAPELIVVVAYGKILPQSVLDIPKFGCINMHASVLPKLRGAGPVQWAILNHFTETGVTAMYLSAGMDEGDIISVEKTAIDPEETAEELLTRLSEIAANLSVRTIEAIAAGTATRTPQNADEATYAPMLTKDLCPIDWTKPASFVRDQVRGLNPWPVATAELAGTRFKIYSVQPTDHKTDAAPGTILSLTKQGLEVACGMGESVIVTQLQAEGGKRMAAPDYFRGHPLTL